MDMPATNPVTPAASQLQVELLTRAGCHLCEEARAVVAEVAGGLGLPWHEVDIDGDAALTARYGEEIPVVLVDGVQRDFWQIDPVRLRTILARSLDAIQPHAFGSGGATS